MLYMRDLVILRFWPAHKHWVRLPLDVMSAVESADWDTFYRAHQVFNNTITACKTAIGVHVRLLKLLFKATHK